MPTLSLDFIEDLSIINFASIENGLLTGDSLDLFLEFGNSPFYEDHLSIIV